MRRTSRTAMAAAGLLAFAAGTAAAEEIIIGNLIDFTGRTAVVGL